MHGLQPRGGRIILARHVPPVQVAGVPKGCLAFQPVISCPLIVFTQLLRRVSEARVWILNLFVPPTLLVPRKSCQFHLKIPFLRGRRKWEEWDRKAGIFPEKVSLSFSW